MGTVRGLCFVDKEGVCQTDAASISLHIFESSLQSPEEHRDLRPPSKPGWFAEVCTGDACTVLSLSKLLS